MSVATRPTAEPAPDRPEERREPLRFAEVYRTHAAFLWRALRRLGVREADVADVCQETFMVVHRRLADYDGSSSVRTWLFGIALRAASDYRRRAHVRREQFGPEPPDPGVSADPLDALDQRRARQILERILETLDDDKRAVFVAYELEQIPMNEIAVALGCPVQTAYSRLHAARRHVEAAVQRLRAREAFR